MKGKVYMDLVELREKEVDGSTVGFRVALVP